MWIFNIIILTFKALGTTASAKDSLDEKMKQLNLDGSVQVSELVERLFRAETEANELRTKFQTLEARVAALEGGKPAAAAPAPAQAKAAPKPAPASASASAAKKDDDFDLFAEEDEESEEKKRITEERLKAYNAKKSNSNILTKTPNLKIS